MDALLVNRGRVCLTSDERIRCRPGRRPDLPGSASRWRGTRPSASITRKTWNCWPRPGPSRSSSRPCATAALPAGIRGIYLGGGYPELHAGRLEANAGLRREIRLAAQAGLPVYAECGGLMYLAESIDGAAMAGVFPAAARLLPRRRALGYREVTLTADCPLGPAGTVARGHEFHYSEMAMPAP